MVKIKEERRNSKKVNTKFIYIKNPKPKHRGSKYSMLLLIRKAIN